MKTKDLIGALAGDATPPPPLWRTAGLAVLVGAVCAAILFFTFLGVRTNFATAVHNWQFQFKIAVFLSVTLVLGIDFYRLMRPGAWQIPFGLILAAAILAGSMVFALTIVPQERWIAHLFASSWRTCLTSIPFLAAAPLITALSAMRASAPASPPLAGMAAGGLAAAVGATIYSTHCPADTPIFYAFWYPLGATIVLAVGALAGRLVLRW